MDTSPVTPRDLADHYLSIHLRADGHIDYRKAYAECLGIAKANAGTAVGVHAGRTCAIIQGHAMKAGVEV